MKIDHDDPYSDQSTYTLPTSRIEALSDGAFAIVMTLLVIDIKVPVIEADATRMEFLWHFLELWPELFNYMISFIILGVYWVGHHKQFHYIQKTNRILLWLNIFFLMFVALIPFSTAFLGTYPNQQFPILIYTFNLALVALFLYIKWTYATNKHRLVRKNLPLKIIQRGKRKILIGILIYLGVVAMSAYNLQISLLLLALVPIFYIMPSKKGD